MKNKFRLKPLALALVTSAGLSVSAPALAVYPVTDAVLIQTVTTSTQSIIQAIGASTNSIIQMLRTMMAANDSSAMKISDVVNRSGNNIVQRTGDLQQLQQADQIARSMAPPIDPCANAGMGFADPMARSFRPGGGFGGNIVNTRFSGVNNRLNTGSARLNDALEIAEGNKPAPSPEVQTMLAQQGACEIYAAEGRAKTCAASGMPTGAVKYPNADINASTLFDGAQTKEDMNKISWTYNDDQLAAVRAYMRNMTNPVSLRELTKQEASTDAGRQYLALRDSYLSRVDMAQKPGLHHASERAYYDKNVPVIEAMIEGAGAAAAFVVANIANYAPKGGNWKQGISNDAMLQIEANRRANNPAWIMEIANQSDPLTLQREQLAVSAHTNYLLTKMLFAERSNGVLLGAIYQSTADNDAMPKLIKAHDKAIGAR